MPETSLRSYPDRHDAGTMRGLGDIFPRSLAVNGPRTALIDRGEASLTYAELSADVTALAGLLRGLSIGAGDRVGICLHKRAAGVAGVLAALETGAAYVPLDALGSVGRVAFILADCAARAVLVESDLAQALADQLACPCNTRVLEGFGLSLLVCDWGDSQDRVFSEDLAMILYTSGSTGVPKGVQVTHRNAVTFIRWGAETFSITTGDVCASIAPFHFDLSVFDLFVSLHRGAAILLLEHKQVQNTLYLSSYLSKYRVTVCYTTPTVLKMLLNFGRLDRYDHTSIRLVLFAGEVFPVKPLQSLRERWGQAAFHNLYGPTETNVVTWHPLPASVAEPRDRPYPIGLPCPYATCRILRDDGEMVALCAGVRGELVVSGDTVTPGYVGNEEHNRQAFIAGGDGSRFYRTGDIVAVNDAGELEFLMRRDRMVKRRGYRIELEEIECALNACPGVSEVAVAAVREEEETVITAYFSPAGSPAGELEASLKRHCLDRLPGYFLPDRFVELAVLPKTSSGKIDYRGLQGLVG